MNPVYNVVSTVFYLLVESRQQWKSVWQDHPYSHYLYESGRFKLNTMFPYKSERSCHL